MDNPNPAPGWAQVPDPALLGRFTDRATLGPNAKLKGEITVSSERWRHLSQVRSAARGRGGWTAYHLFTRSKCILIVSRFCKILFINFT
jgi:hypothetical protein